MVLFVDSEILKPQIKVCFERAEDNTVRVSYELCTTPPVVEQILRNSTWEASENMVLHLCGMEGVVLSFSLLLFRNAFCCLGETVLRSLISWKCTVFAYWLLSVVMRFAGGPSPRPEGSA